MPVAILLATLAVHVALWPVPSPDLEQFLEPWYRHLADRGLVAGFSEPFGNYSPPYLYLLGLVTLTEPWLGSASAIKALSVAGSLALGLAVMRLLRVSGAPNPPMGGLWTPLLPTVAANAVLMSQCDALWVAPCLMAVAASIERRHAAMLAWDGLGFAVKAQAAFLAPFLFAVLLQRRVSAPHWLIPPAVTVALMIPAALAGWPVSDLLLKYVNQSSQLPSFVSNASNPWVVLAVLAPAAGKALVPVGFGLAGAASLWLAWRLRSAIADTPAILRAALLSALFVPTPLPKMHERYFLLADVLAFVLALTLRDRRSVAIAILTSAGSALAIAAYAVQAPWLAIASAIPSGAALLLVWRQVSRHG